MRLGEPPRKLTQISVAQMSPHTEEELPRTTENFDTKNVGVLVHPWSGGGALIQVCAPPTHVTAVHVTAVHAILRDVVLTIPNPTILITGILTRGTTGGLSPIRLSPRAPPGEAWRESSVSLDSRQLGIQNGPAYSPYVQGQEAQRQDGRLQIPYVQRHARHQSHNAQFLYRLAELPRPNFHRCLLSRRVLSPMVLAHCDYKYYVWLWIVGHQPPQVQPPQPGVRLEVLVLQPASSLACVSSLWPLTHWRFEQVLTGPQKICMFSLDGCPNV